MRKPHLTIPQIGSIFGRDRTTVIHAIEAHEARMAWVEFLVWAGKPETCSSVMRQAA